MLLIPGYRAIDSARRPTAFDRADGSTLTARVTKAVGQVPSLDAFAATFGRDKLVALLTDPVLADYETSELVSALSFQQVATSAASASQIATALLTNSIDPHLVDIETARAAVEKAIADVPGLAAEACVRSVTARELTDLGKTTLWVTVRVNLTQSESDETSAPRTAEFAAAEKRIQAATAEVVAQFSGMNLQLIVDGNDD